MADEQLGLDSLAAEQAVVSVFEQIVAVLARQADAAISDAVLFQSELHQLLTMEKIKLEGGHSTADEAREVAVGVTTALRLLVAELVALTVGGTVEALRERAPLLWNAKSLIEQASAVRPLA